jgi:hypothetical protein
MGAASSKKSGVDTTYETGFNPETSIPDQAGKVSGGGWGGFPASLLLVAAPAYTHSTHTHTNTPQVILITGGNTGIGYEVALVLLKKGAKVYLACRSPQRAAEAIAKLKAATGSELVEFLQLDLQDLKQVDKAATEFAGRERKLDALLNNAGIMACPFALTKDGLESQVGPCVA